jgi:hypothetical protein
MDGKKLPEPLCTVGRSYDLGLANPDATICLEAAQRVFGNLKEGSICRFSVSAKRTYGKQP